MDYKSFPKLLLIILSVASPAACFSQTTLSFAQLNDISQHKATFEEATSKEKKADAAYMISRYYADRLKIDSALFFANKIKELSEEAKYKKGTGKYHLAMAGALFYRSRYDDAQENIFSAISIFHDCKDLLYLGLAYRQQAAILRLKGDLQQSRINYWTSIYFLRASGDSNACYRAYLELARSYRNTGNVDSAAAYFIKSLVIAENIHDRERIFTSSGDLGDLFLKTGNLVKARKYIEYCLDNISSVSKVSRRMYLYYYAQCLIAAKENEKADSVISQVEILNQQLTDTYGMIILNHLKGDLAYEQKNYRQGLSFLQAAYNKVDEIPSFGHDIKDILFSLGKTEVELGSYDSAVIHLRKALQMSHELKLGLDEMESSLLLSKAFEKKNEPDSALHYYRNYVELKESKMALDVQRTLIETTTRYETEKKEQEIKILQKEGETNSFLLQLKNQQIEKQRLLDDKNSQQLEIISKQNEISKLDAQQKTLSLENQKKETEKNQDSVKFLEKEAALQKVLIEKQDEQKKIAIISIVMILLLGGYSFYRYLHRKKLQQQQVVLKERLRISRELHDEVGSTLSGIAMYSHLAKGQIKAIQTAEVERSLNIMQQSAGEMVIKLNDIVWLVNPEQDSLHKLMERLEEYAGDMAAVKNMQVRINIPETLVEKSLPVESRRNIYLFCKEAINNAVKYSEASLVELTIKEPDSKKLEFIISDNGKGFDEANIKKGNGLINMEKRAEEIKAQYSLQSAPGKGTSVSLKYKIT